MTWRLHPLFVLALALAPACSAPEYGAIPAKYTVLEVFGEAGAVPEAPVVDPFGNVAGIARPHGGQASAFAWNGDDLTDLDLVHVAALDPSGAAFGTAVIGGAMQAARADAATGVAEPLLDDTGTSCATAVDGDGGVYGIHFDHGVYRWTATNDPTWLPGWWFPMDADRAQVVGVMPDPQGRDVPVRWTARAGLERLGLGEAATGVALGTFEGVTVGAVGGDPAMWVGRDLVVLDLLPGATGGIANAVNADGVVVGEDDTAEGTTAWVVADGHKSSLTAPGWTLLTASDVNDAGDIVGTATREGDPTVRVVLLTSNVSD